MILYVNRHEVIKTVFKYFNEVLHENFEGCSDAIRQIETFKGDEAKIFTGEQKNLMIKALKQYRDCASDFLSYDEFIDLSNKVGEIIKLLDVEGEIK